MAVTDPSTAYEVELAPKRGLADLPVALLLAMRPRQWSKNLFVYAALIFTNNIPTSFADHVRWHNFLITTLAFVLYCLLSSGVYLVNDVVDREQDRLHPEKRKRPIASGRLPWRVALIAGSIFGVGGVIASFAINRNFGLLALGYYLLQIAYTFAIKHMVLLDVFAIAAGFVFRAVAGALAMNVAISVWLLVCTLQLALFLGFGKRRHELISLEENAVNHRQILSQYSVPFLDQMISIVLGTLTVSYALYTITSETAKAHPGLVVTLPVAMYGIFRYLYLIHMEHKGGSPETILKEDRPLQVTLLIWIAAVIASFKFA